MVPDQSSANDELIRDAIAGNEAALADLFELHRDRLCRMVALRMDERVRARFDASDVVQEAFVDVARRLNDYDEKKSAIPFFLWMCMVTTDRLGQLHRQHLGAQKRDPNREVSMVPKPAMFTWPTNSPVNSHRWIAGSSVKTFAEG